MKPGESSRTAEQVAAIIKAYDEPGATYSTVGKLLGLNRSQVSGVLGRWRRANGIPAKARVKVDQEPREAPEPPEPARSPVQDGIGCRWIAGDPAQVGFEVCGASLWRGSYCAPHYARCHHRSPADQAIDEMIG